jgi:FkbM family methyltransferase
MKIHTREFEIEITDDVNNDMGIIGEVQTNDCYRVRDNQHLNPNIVVDIGAHIGTFSMMAAAYWPTCKIYAFEPVPEWYRCLITNVPSAIAYNEAIIGFLNTEEGHDVYRSNDFEDAYHKGHRTNGISITTMFDVCDIDHIDFLKIDCEGSEVNIFRELDYTNKLKDIHTIHGEWHFDEGKKVIREIVAKTHDVELIDVGEWNHFYAVRK